jgi:hypothetical protein
MVQVLAVSDLVLQPHVCEILNTSPPPASLQVRIQAFDAGLAMPSWHVLALYVGIWDWSWRLYGKFWRLNLLFYFRALTNQSY